MHDWIWILFFAVLLIAAMLMKRSGQIDSGEARQLLGNGALLIDVRTPAEFSSGHLPQAINVPLGEIASAIPRRAPQKDQVLLLHCQSGMRSGSAQRQLRAVGYTHAYNLGSYGRAAHIAERQ